MCNPSQGFYGSNPTLSPRILMPKYPSLQAAKVLAAAQDAYWAVDEMSSDHPEDIAAAVAKELADQVVPEQPTIPAGDLTEQTYRWDERSGIRAHILAIATELTDSTRETLTVRLTYFKASGKYYTNGFFKTNPNTSLLDIWEEVKQMRKAGNLPGLVEGAKEFNVLINVPGHRHEHPRFLMLP